MYVGGRIQLHDWLRTTASRALRLTQRARALEQTPPALQTPGYFAGGIFNASLGVTVNFFIAARHFNDRRGDVLSVLGELGSCPTMINIPRLCDTQCFVPRLIRDLKEYGPDYRALVGFASSTDLVSGAPFADQEDDLVIVDHWSSSPLLADRSLYPKLIRVGQDDGQYAHAVLNLLRDLNYTRAVLMHLAYDSGPAFGDAMEAIAFSKGIELLRLQYTDSVASSIDQVAFLAAQSRYNALIFYGCTLSPSLDVQVNPTARAARADSSDYAESDQGDLPGAARAHGLLDGQHQWIFCNYDTPPTAKDFASDENVTALFKGALRITTTIPDEYRARFYGNYSQLWVDEFPAYRADINTRLPPFGTMDDFNTCKNDELPYQMFDDFFNFTQPLQNEVWCVLACLRLVQR